MEIVRHIQKNDTIYIIRSSPFTLFPSEEEHSEEHYATCSVLCQGINKQMSADISSWMQGQEFLKSVCTKFIHHNDCNFITEIMPHTSISCFLCISPSCSDSLVCCLASSSACNLHISALRVYSCTSFLLLSTSLFSFVFSSANSPLSLSS